MGKKIWEIEAEKRAKAARRRAEQGHLPPLPHQHWAPGHGLAPVQTGHQDCNVPAQLPQFGAPAVQGSRHLALVRPGQAVPAVVEQRRGDSLIAAGQKAIAATEAVSSWSWRNRWNLTPAAASALAMSASTVDPLLALTALMGVGGASVLVPDEVRGRKWLSRRERKIVAAWAGGGFVWTLGAMPGLWGMDPAGMVAFGALTGVQTGFWVASRRIRGEDWKSTLLGLFGFGNNDKALEAAKPAELSEKARELLETWAQAMASLKSPQQLLHSQIVPGSMREPNAGIMSFTVELRDTVHAQDAVGDELRKTLERQMRLGVDSVSLAPNRDDSGQIKVTIIHDRSALAINTEWTGELVHLPDGSTEVPFAVSTEGEAIAVYLNNDAGVEHAFISGTTGVGKSNSLATMVLPGIMAGVEVMLYVDGGGNSAAHLAGAADWWAVKGVDQQKAAIRAAYLIMDARRIRRGEQGLSRWRGPKVETDPAITLVLDEAPKLTKALGNSGTRDREDGSFISYADMVLEILQQGRKVGVRVIQLAQDALGTDSVGGRPARDLAMSGGICVGHRPTGATSNQLTQSSTADGVDLRALPEESGWCAVWRRGKLKSRQARTRYADEKIVPDMLTKLSIRGLEGADAEVAAIAGYRSRVYGPDAAVAIKAAVAEEAAGTTTAEVISIHRTAEAPTEIGLGGPVAPAAMDTASTPNADEPVAAGVSISEAEEIAAQFPELARLTGAAATGQEAGAMNRFRVLEILRTEPEGIKFGAILDQVEFPKGTLSRALKRLATDGDAHKTDDGCWHAGAAEMEAS